MKIGSGVIGTYTHNHGAYAALVALECPATAAGEASVQTFANRVAQHLVAVDPEAEGAAGVAALYEASFLFDETVTVKQAVEAESAQATGDASAFQLSFVRWGPGE